MATPIVWIFTLLLWGILTKKPVRKKRMLWAAVICFYFFSNSFLTDEFMRIYEDRTVSYRDLTETYDAVIVLGGFSTDDPGQGQIQFHSATDRLMAGLKLYKTGRAKKLMISSGSGSISRPDEKEALYIKEFLLEIGIPSEDLIIEGESKNTHENAVFSADILKRFQPNGKFLLVTSAFHMPRAKRCFEKAGLQITPFSVDHQAGPRGYTLDHLLIPQTDSLLRWQMLIKEWIGFVMYKMMGYC